MNLKIQFYINSFGYTNFYIIFASQILSIYLFLMKVNDFEEAYAILKNYKGKNNQILYYQYKVQRTNYSLTEFDVTYILNNFDFEPYEINKTVKIAKDYGEILKKKYELDFLPEKYALQE